MSPRSSPIVALWLVLAAVPAAAQEAAPPPAATMSLDVPYLPQSTALCGGAAVAMVFRYWGDAHAGAEQFAPLIDWRAGGIADDDLVDAIRQRGWRAARIAGSVDALREQIGRNRPVIILLEDRPLRYHYLVVTGIDADAVLLHDPSWGPSRRLPIGDLIRAWRPTRFWALVVLPSQNPVAPSKRADMMSQVARTDCDVWLAEAVARVRSQGLNEADVAFGELQARCPDQAGPLRELAGVRFAQRRWREAAQLAGEALARDPLDTYAWDVLASSRFVQDDFAGALRAWNRIGKPRVDSIDITGLRHARYESIASALDLTPNTLLTADAFARAARRLNELPDRASARISYRPAEDGFASVDVAIAERAARPRGAVEWSTVAAKSLVNREVDIGVPGFAGQGEVWSASWRWWSERPRAAVAFTTPRTGMLGGVWRVDGSWESQRYVGAEPHTFITETRAHGGLTMGDWLSGAVRYRISAGFDEWNGKARTASIAAAFEQRFAGDRIAVAADAAAFMPVSRADGFQSAAVRADARTSAAASGWVLAASAGATGVTARAPLALWPGAGDGHARPALLRAHPLLEGAAIGGPAFGRVLIHGSGEAQRWIGLALPVRVAVAGFIDVARAARRMPFAGGDPFHVDAGLGVRVKIPGTAGTLRADVGRGLRDRATAFTIGWQY